MHSLQNCPIPSPIILVYFPSNFLFTIAIRFSDDAAYIKWSSGDTCEKFAVAVQDKHEKKSYDAQSNQLVLTKLRPDTCYRVTVSGLSQDGVCVWSSAVPIPSNVKPNGIRVTGRTSTSLTVEWNVSKAVCGL